MNTRLAWISTTAVALLLLVGYATNTVPTGIKQSPDIHSTIKSSPANTPRNLTTNSSSAVHGTRRSSHTALSVQQLSLQTQSKFLGQMSNPGQGEDCLNSSCSVTGTNFTGPSVTNPNVTLHMLYAEFRGWYIIVAPTTSNALTIGQHLIRKPLNFPYPHGVMVVHSRNADYYWITNGKKNLKSERLPIVAE